MWVLGLLSISLVVSLIFSDSLFHGPLCYFFGPWCCDFLDLNNAHNYVIAYNWIVYGYKQVCDDILNSSLGHSLKDTLTIVSFLKNWFFSHTFRQCNVADALTRRVKLFSPLLV